MSELTMEQGRRMFPKVRAGRDPRLALAAPGRDAHTLDENCPVCCLVQRDEVGKVDRVADVCRYLKVSPIEPLR